MSLPTFLVIGAARAGTTALHRALGSHPQIYMSPIKEPNFFALSDRPAAFQGPHDPQRINRWSVWREADYRALFEPGRDRLARGESSVLYLYHPEAAEAIVRRLPEVRLVAILRDPAERAWSTYLYLRLLGFEEAPTFEEALRREPARIEAGWQHIWHYRQMGFYAAQLSRYLARFPKEKIRVYLYEDLCERPEALFRDLFSFLGVDPEFTPTLDRRENASGLPRLPWLHRLVTGDNAAKNFARRMLVASWRNRVSRAVERWNLTRPPLDPGLRARLVREFRDDVLRLQETIGRDLSAWLEESRSSRDRTSSPSWRPPV